MYRNVEIYFHPSDYIYLALLFLLSHPIFSLYATKILFSIYKFSFAALGCLSRSFTGSGWRFCSWRHWERDRKVQTLEEIDAQDYTILWYLAWNSKTHLKKVYKIQGLKNVFWEIKIVFVEKNWQCLKYAHIFGFVVLFHRLTCYILSSKVLLKFFIFIVFEVV